MDIEHFPTVGKNGVDVYDFFMYNSLGCFFLCDTCLSFFKKISVCKWLVSMIWIQNVFFKVFLILKVGKSTMV